MAEEHNTADKTQKLVLSAAEGTERKIGKLGNQGDRVQHISRPGNQDTWDARQRSEHR